MKFQPADCSHVSLALTAWPLKTRLFEVLSYFVNYCVIKPPSELRGRLATTNLRSTILVHGPLTTWTAGLQDGAAT